ncbi:hypothetical protein F7R20_26030 [Pseudomonas brassicacearum subsp. brassicacearum]|nr:hypothetical protein F7R20_26030 [Pseudomonas brassicacearum subsp. brassicacearum]
MGRSSRSNCPSARVSTANTVQKCGSELARDSGGSVDITAGGSAAFASKPAPTVDRVSPEGTRSNCGSRACSRWRWISLH